MGIDRRRYLMAASADLGEAPEYAMAVIGTTMYAILSGSMDGGLTWTHSTPKYSSWRYQLYGSFWALPNGCGYLIMTSSNNSGLEYIWTIGMDEEGSDLKNITNTAKSVQGYTSAIFALSERSLVWRNDRTNTINIISGSVDLYGDPALSGVTDISGTAVHSLESDPLAGISVSQDGRVILAGIASYPYLSDTGVAAVYSEAGGEQGTWGGLLESQSSGKSTSVDMSNNGQVCVVTTTDGHYFSRTGPSGLVWTGSTTGGADACAVSGNGRVIYIDNWNSPILSVDSGITWETLSTEYYGMEKIVINYKGDKLLMMKRGTLYRSLDYGRTLEEIDIGYGYYPSYSDIKNIAMNKWKIKKQ